MDDRKVKRSKEKRREAKRRQEEARLARSKEQIGKRRLKAHSGDVTVTMTVTP